MSRRAVVAVAATVVLAGCPTFPTGTGHRYACTVSADCAGLGPGMVCQGGVCVWPDGGSGDGGVTDGGSGDGGVTDGGTSACGADGGCAGHPGFTCVNQQCVALCQGGATTCAPGAICDASAGCLPGDGTSCTDASTCPPGFQCATDGVHAGSVCLRPCQGYEDCLQGWTCDTSASHLCLPNACGPSVSGQEGYQGTCPTPGAGGRCIGPRGGGLGVDGLCYLDGPLAAGQPCDLTQPVKDGGQCAATLVCASAPPLTSPPPNTGPHCQQACRGWSANDCPSTATCYPVWGATGVCVSQPGASALTAITGTCTNPFSDTTKADARECAQGALCAPDHLCHQACNAGTDEQDCSSGTCTSLGLAAHPYLGYCPLP